MEKESISYEMMIDIITNIVKRCIDNEQILVTKEGDDKCLNIEL